MRSDEPRRGADMPAKLKKGETMDKRLIVMKKDFEGRAEICALAAGFLFHGWQLVLIEREKRLRHRMSRPGFP